MSQSPKTALCLLGGGVTGALYQVGALSAMEAVVGGLSFDMFVGTSSGSALAAAMAADVSVQRLYRAMVDPADNYFPLERNHLLKLDFNEWRRTVFAAISSMRRGFASLLARSPTPTPTDLWEQLDRFFDTLPAGLFTLDRYEGFLADVFMRRRVPNSFRAISKPLLITAMDLDLGEPVLFGAPGLDHVPVSLACAASMALPIFFSPVRIGQRYYVDGGLGPMTELDVARERGAELIVVINPNVPVRPAASSGVPTGHGAGSSIRDKGLMWVFNQAMRTTVHARLKEATQRIESSGAAKVLVIEPDPQDAVRFLHNAATLAARREILLWSHRSARDTVRAWAGAHPQAFARAGWRLLSQSEAERPPVVGASPD